MVEDPGGRDYSGLGGAVGGGEEEWRAEESPELGLEAPVAIHESLVPILKLPGPLLQFADLLVLAGLALPGLGQLPLQLEEPAAGNGYEVVVLWGEEERKGLCEGGAHAEGWGRKSSMNPSVEAKERMLHLGIRAKGQHRQRASGT
ncbi:MAG TPA: hypothetical protein VMH38_07960 [Thermoplasmata archaeon]|nr:hypothetical protein [Thermoplasmata archaeon]